MEAQGTSGSVASQNRNQFNNIPHFVKKIYICIPVEFQRKHLDLIFCFIECKNNWLQFSVCNIGISDINCWCSDDDAWSVVHWDNSGMDPWQLPILSPYKSGPATLQAKQYMESIDQWILGIFLLRYSCCIFSQVIKYTTYWYIWPMNCHCWYAFDLQEQSTNCNTYIQQVRTWTRLFYNWQISHQRKIFPNLSSHHSTYCLLYMKVGQDIYKYTYLIMMQQGSSFSSTICK